MKRYTKTPKSLGLEYECADGSTISLRFDKVSTGVCVQWIHSRAGPIVQLLLTTRQARELAKWLDQEVTT